jgi:hypothetical protein
VGITNPLLELHLFTAQNGALTEVMQGAPVMAGQSFYVEVKGIELALGLSTQGPYSMTILLG